MQPMTKENALAIIKDTINVAQSSGKLKIEDSVVIMQAFNFIKTLQVVATGSSAQDKMKELVAKKAEQVKETAEINENPVSFCSCLAKVVLPERDAPAIIKLFINTSALWVGRDRHRHHRWSGSRGVYQILLCLYRDQPTPDYAPSN